jgi:PAS domain S-box-containing protein
MILGSCAPYVITVVYLSGVFPTRIDLSPFGFAFSSVFFLWGTYKYNMMRIVPLALQKVFESMQDAVIVCDLEHAVTRFNQSAGRIVAGLDESAMGKPIRHLIPLNADLLGGLSMPTADSPNPIYTVERPDGTCYQVQESLICDGGQDPVGWMMVLRDITETVRKERRLLDNARQLGEMNAFKDQIFRVIAHDIRDPLTMLVDLTELLEEEVLACGGEHEEIVVEMKRQVQNTFALTESLLDWFRSQRAGVVFNPVVWDLDQAVLNAARLLQVRSEAKGIKVATDIPPHMFIYADKEMLDLIIRNLLSNAIKFTEPGGEIQVKAEMLLNKIVVAVSDSGKGVAVGQAQALLQGESPISSIGTAGERGVGLGLSLCREFVRLHGGEIWFDSVQEQGSTFYFSIPASSEADIQSTA